MGEQTVVTSVIAVSTNNVSDDDAEQLCNQYGVDSLGEVASELESSVEALVVQQLFGDADGMPIIDVDTEVMEEFDEEDAEQFIA